MGGFGGSLSLLLLHFFGVLSGRRFLICLLKVDFDLWFLRLGLRRFFRFDLGLLRSGNWFFGRFLWIGNWLWFWRQLWRLNFDGFRIYENGFGRRRRRRCLQCLLPQNGLNRRGRLQVNLQSGRLRLLRSERRRRQNQQDQQQGPVDACGNEQILFLVHLHWNSVRMEMSGIPNFFNKSSTAITRPYSTVLSTRKWTTILGSARKAPAMVDDKLARFTSVWLR